jgi:hypothetical protein
MLFWCTKDGAPWQKQDNLHKNILSTLSYITDQAFKCNSKDLNFNLPNESNVDIVSVMKAATAIQGEIVLSPSSPKTHVCYH